MAPTTPEDRDQMADDRRPTGRGPAMSAAREPRRSRAAIVFRKEVREAFRDNRTVFGVIISPLLITPLLLALVGTVVSRQARQARVEILPVGLVGAAAAPSMRQSLQGAPNLRIEAVTEAEAERQIRARRLRAAAVLPPDAETRFREQRAIPVQLLLDEGNQTSRDAAGRLRQLFVERGQRLAAQRLRERGLSSELMAPFAVTEKPISGGGTQSSFIFAIFLPYALVFSAIIGGLHAANDLVAGEKERGTLEALLVSPASRRDLVLGKFATVAVVSLVSSFLSLVGLLLPLFFRLPGLEWMAHANLKLTGVGMATMLFAQLPLAVLGAGVLLAISTYARNQKEAQSYLGPVMIVVTVMAMLSMILKPEASWLLGLVPILNAAMALKQALSHTVNGLFITVAFASSVAYAGLAVAIATRLFEKESVLLKA